jgi:hypothetical protein
MNMPSGGFAPMPPPPPERVVPVGPPPRLVHIATVLLLVNLGLSVLVTILSFVYQDEIIRLTLAQTHRADVTEAVEHTIKVSLWVRAGVNVLIGMLYLFLISRLRRGKRWAWRRMVWLSIAGCVGMIFLLTQHYPPIFKVEQVLQFCVLAGIAVCVLHPETRAHFAKR